MNASPIAIVLAVGMTAGAALLVTRVHPPHAASAALDFPDDPVSVAVDAAGDVIVGLTTDVASGVVRRFTAAGELRSATAWTGALAARPFVAEGPGGTVFVAQSEAGEIAVVDEQGAITWRWKVPGFSSTPGSFGGIVASAFAEGEFFVFARVRAADSHRLVQYRWNGKDWGDFSIGPSAYDIAVGPVSDDEVRAYVVRPGPVGGSARIVAFRLDGTIDTASSRDIDGDVLGIDTTSTGTLRMIIRPELSPSAYLDGRGGPVMAGDPSDLAVAPDGDLWVVSHLADRDPGVVLHYTARGCFVETWPNDLLNGASSAAPTPGPSLCPGQAATPTATPDRAPSPTPAATHSPTPTPSEAMATPGTPTPMRTRPSPLEAGPIYLPLNLGMASPQSVVANEGHGEVVLQVQDGGGLPSPPFFKMDIERSPWFTLYSDGTYVRTSDDLSLGWRVGALAADRVSAIIADLLADEAVFPQLNNLCWGVCLCVTDGPTTRLMVRDGERRVTAAAYLGRWLGRADRCAPIAPRPTVVAGDRILAVAQHIDALDARLDPAEALRRIGHVTVYAEPSDTTWLEPIPWPLDRPIGAVAGRDTLTEGEIVRLVEAVDAAGGEYRWSRAVPFADASGRWDVGLRAEPPGWTTYCVGEPNCPSP